MGNLRKVKVEIFTEQLAIEGNVYLEEGFRVTDYLNKSDTQFIPITEAKIYNQERKAEQEVDYIVVNKGKIICVKEKS